jgi:cellulose synthase/poly-beta-1,6-N-acetylglucosamine synthase-like glycosyltransferase
MGEILQFLGIDDLEAESKKERKLVSIVCCSNRPQMIKNVKLNFEQQLYENVEMIVMLQASSNDFKDIKKELEKDSRIKVRKQLVKDSLGKTFNKGLKYCKGDFVAKFDDDDMYGPNYISDSIDAFNYTDADVVGKYGVFVYDEGTGNFYYRNKGSSNRYLQIVMGATIIAKREVFESVSFPDRTTGEDTEFLRRCLAKKMKIFSSNPFNWVLVRKKEEGFHTWDDKGSLTSGSSERLDISVDDIFI